MQPGASLKKKAFSAETGSIRIKSVWQLIFSVFLCVSSVLPACSSLTGNLPNLTDERPNEISEPAASRPDGQSAIAENTQDSPPAPHALITPRLKPERTEIYTPIQLAEMPEKPSLLLGMSDQSITEIFGDPHDIEPNGASIIWNYRTSICSLQIVFYQDIEDETFHALQYALTDGNGEPPDDAQPCFDSIQISNEHG